MTAHPPLILASASPRRQQLLADAGYRFEVVPPPEGIEPPPAPGTLVEAHVQHLAFLKAQAVAAKMQRGIVLGADTVACCDGCILGKPIDREDAGRMLRQLSGTEHQVISGVCVWHVDNGTPDVRSAVTTLSMDALDEGQIERYLDTNQWRGKAGAFGYQDGLDWVHIRSGSESNVVGLPMELLAGMLSDAGYPTPGTAQH